MLLHSSTLQLTARVINLTNTSRSSLPCLQRTGFTLLCRTVLSIAQHYTNRQKITCARVRVGPERGRVSGGVNAGRRASEGRGEGRGTGDPIPTIAIPTGNPSLAALCFTLPPLPPLPAYLLFSATSSSLPPEPCPCPSFPLLSLPHLPSPSTQASFSIH